MSQFIYFTPEEKARAQNTDLVSLLRTQGERPVRSGREFRPPNDPSAITASLIRRRFCFCWAERTVNRMSRQSL